MVRRMSLVGAGVAALALLLVRADVASAQGKGRGGGGGGGRGYAAPSMGRSWSGGNWNGGNWYGDGNWDGYGYRNYSYWNRPYYSYGWYPYRYSYPYVNNYYYYDYGVPYYGNAYRYEGYNPDYVSGYYNPDIERSTGGYDNSDMERSADRVTLEVRVPDGADVWIDGHQTRQRGTIREFQSPPLQPGQDYRYEVRASWMEDGRRVDRTKEVAVRAGERVSVDMEQAPERGTAPEVPPDRDRNLVP